MKKYSNYSTKLKSRIILDVLKNEKTLNQIASENQVPPKNIINWKKKFMENIDLVFEKDKALSEYKERLQKLENEKDNLFRIIGQLISSVCY